MLRLMLAFLLFTILHSVSLNDVSAAHTTVVETKGRQQQQTQAPAPVIQIEHGWLPYNATFDAVGLSEAMVGLGTNEEGIIILIANRTNSQRQLIRAEYERLYQKDLIEDVKDDLSGGFEEAIIALIRKPYEFLSMELHRTLTSLIVIDTHVVAELLCTKTATELELFNRAYYDLYGKTIKDAVAASTEGLFQKFLENILTEPRRYTITARNDLVDSHLENIPTTGDNCGPKENPKLDNLLAREPFRQLQHDFEIYAQKKNRTVASSLKRWCSDEALLDAYLTVVAYAENPAEYYAKEINDAVMGLGTNNKALIRIIVSRHETDLGDIKKAYERMYATTLASSISKETSGYYRSTLLSLTDP